MYKDDIRKYASPELLSDAEKFIEQIKNGTFINRHVILYNKEKKSKKDLTK